MFIKNTSSASFEAIWSSGTDNFPDRSDGLSSVAYLSSSLIVNQPTRTSFNHDQRRLLITMKNLHTHYRKNDVVKLRVFIEDRDRDIVFKKTPIETPSQIFENMYYQVKDAQSDRIIIPFDTSKNKKRLKFNNLLFFTVCS